MNEFKKLCCFMMLKVMYANCGKNIKFNLRNSIKSGEYSHVPLHLALRPGAQRAGVYADGVTRPHTLGRGAPGRSSAPGHPEERLKEGACRVLALDRTLEARLFCSVGGRGVSQLDGTGTALSPPAAAAAAVGLAAVMGPVAAEAGPAQARWPLPAARRPPLGTVAPGWEAPSSWPVPRCLSLVA